jgi:hypothetical protein
VGLAAPAVAQSPTGTWNGLPDRFQIDAGYFRLGAETVLRFEGGDVDFERDLGVPEDVDTFWVDATWRVGRRHQVKLAITRVNRDRGANTLTRDFEWGGQTYPAGITTRTETAATVVGGYYRFAAYRNDRFEVGPTVGIGHLSLDARVRGTGTVGGASFDIDRSASTGSVTAAIGGYTTAWATPRLALHGDFLYIKVSPGESEASVTDWRLNADYYFFRNAGLGVQYKYNRYRYDRGILSTDLGGHIRYQGFQAFLSFLF